MTTTTVTTTSGKSTLILQKQLLNGAWVVTGYIVPGGFLPVNIFVYENTGTSTLGTFYGTAAVKDFTRMQTWKGKAIPVFGNKFVLYSSVKINVDQFSDPDGVMAALTVNVKKLSLDLHQVNSSSQAIEIP